MKVKPKAAVYWYTLRTPKVTPLSRDLSVDVVIAGGGIAGLMCAQKLKAENKNLRIAVVESTVCGGGASGKSSGFITPDSELELSDLVKIYGPHDARRLWDFARGGVNSIRDTVSKRSLKCDFVVQDSLFIANDKKGLDKVKYEYDVHRKLGYDAWFYDKEKVEKVIGSQAYEGAVRSKETFGIVSYLFCQELKESLLRENILIFEETPVIEITNERLVTKNYAITAEKIIVCTDRFLPDFRLAEKEIYSAQTFLAVSRPLPYKVVQDLFPHGPMMVWDTDLIYQYYRIVQGNRLLLGAASLFYTYRGKEKRYAPRVLRKMQKYLKAKFPSLKIEFEYFWPGLIGVSKDFLPIIGQDPVMRNVSFIGACAGLPWAAAAGEYIAERLVHGRKDLDDMFSPERRFPINRQAQIVLSKPLSFAISHAIKKYFL